jgi:hypothetical protein
MVAKLRELAADVNRLRDNHIHWDKFAQLACDYFLLDAQPATNASGSSSKLVDAQPAGEPDDCCEVCHEPISDGCVCQDNYRREHDSGDMSR